MGHELELLIGLLAVVALGAWLGRIAHLPYPIVLMAAGLAIGFVPGLPRLELDPDLIFLLFLPPLIHAAALQSSPRHLRRDARPIALLAIGVVLITMAGVAVVAHAVLDGLSWPAAWVLGAILSPTDTVAATAVFRRLGVPERVVTLVEGESLLNDGVALVAYRIAVVAAVTGSFSPAEAARDLLIVGAGGAVVGLAVAWVIGHVRRRLDDPMIEITISLLTPYLCWIPAEELGLSGVLAVVSSGLYLGWKGPELFSPGTRLQAYPFWRVLTFLLESLLFILIGLQVPGVLDRLSGQSPLALAGGAALVAATVMAVRFVFPFTVGHLDEVLERRRGQRRAPLSSRERALIGWSGRRGAVSLAAALAIPQGALATAPLPERDLLLFLTLATIGATLVVQGLTLPALVRRLGIEEEQGGDERKRAMARFRTIEAALGRIGELSFESDMPTAVVERARGMYTSRARQITGLCRIGVPATDTRDERAWRELRLELLEVERARLLELRNEGALSAKVVSEVEEELDMEEARLRSGGAAAAAPPAVTAPMSVGPVRSPGVGEADAGGDGARR